MMQALALLFHEIGKHADKPEFVRALADVGQMTCMETEKSEARVSRAIRDTLDGIHAAVRSKHRDLPGQKNFLDEEETSTHPDDGPV